MRSLFILLCLSHVPSTQSQKKSTPTGVYCKTGKFAGICLEVKTDSTFLYSEWTDLQTLESNGKWRTNNDTIILNSSLQKENLPITIKEITSQNSDSLIFIEIPTNLSVDLMHDATIYINEDTIKHCMPAFENDCRFRKGEVKTLRVELSENVTSKWHKINNPSSDTIKIIIQIENYLDNFIFMKDLKYLKNSRSIVPLLIKQSSNSKSNYVRSNITLIKRKS